MERPSRLTQLFWLGMLVAGCASVLTLNWELLFACALALTLSILPFAFESWSGVHSPPSFMSAISLFIFASILLGEAGNFYERFWWWDLLLHTSAAVVFGMIGFVIILMMVRGDRVQTSHLLMCLFAFTFAVSIGTLWELFEFLVDLLFATSMQKSGLADTMSDLFVNVIGASIGALSGYGYLKGSRGEFTRYIRGFVERNRALFDKNRN